MKIHKTDIHGREVTFKAWDTEIEKEYLIEKGERFEAGEDFGLMDAYDLLIADSVTEHLTYNQKLYVLFQARRKSAGDLINVQYACASCNKMNDVDVSLRESIKFASDFKTEDYGEVIVSFPFEFDNDSKYWVDVEYDDESYEMNKKDFEEFIQELGINTHKKITESFKTKGDHFSVSPVCQCIYCAEDTVLKFNEEQLLNMISDADLTGLYQFISNMNFYGNYSIADIHGMKPYERDVFFGMLEKLREIND